MTEEQENHPADYFELEEQDAPAENPDAPEAQGTEEIVTEETIEGGIEQGISKEIEDDINKTYEPNYTQQREYIGDDSKFKELIAVPAGDSLYPMIDGRPILNKDLPNSNLSPGTVRYLELLSSGINMCNKFPRLDETFRRYAGYLQFRTSAECAKNGWGRNSFSTSTHRKAFDIRSEKKEENRRLF